eukprot:5294114-Pyramimonas_sp.AAC.1
MARGSESLSVVHTPHVYMTESVWSRWSNLGALGSPGPPEKFKVKAVLPGVPLHRLWALCAQSCT